MSAGRGAATAALIAVLAAAMAQAADQPLPPGTYRLEMRLGARTELPLLGAARTATVSLSLVELRRRGNRLEQTHRVCATRFEGGLPFVRMMMPERFVAALGERADVVEVAPAGEHWAYRADLGLEHIGYRPRDPGAVLPTHADDATVIDWDGDGHPGATLTLSIAGLADGELYVVQRGHSLLDGRVVALGQAEGRVDVRAFDQALLGASPSFLNRSPCIELDPERSTFRLVRVADGTGCADIDTAAYNPGTPVSASAGRGIDGAALADAAGSQP